MIIFRSSLLLLALAACSDGADGTDPKESDVELPIEVQVDGRGLSLREVVQEYESNPSRFAVRYDGKSYDVEGRVQRVGAFNETLDRVGGYFLPLKDGCDSWLCEEMAMEDPAAFKGAVSAFVMEFSTEKTAELDVGQKVRLHCKEITIVSEDIVFRDCKMR